MKTLGLVLAVIVISAIVVVGGGGGVCCMAFVAVFVDAVNNFCSLLQECGNLVACEFLTKLTLCGICG